jgi:hypothetical protein
MEHANRWTVAVFTEESDGTTRAAARLDTGTNVITGHGLARCNPSDRDVPEIGEELAVARALSDLAHALFDATVADLEAVTHQRAVLPPR